MPTPMVLRDRPHPSFPTTAWQTLLYGLLALLMLCLAPGAAMAQAPQPKVDRAAIVARSLRIAQLVDTGRVEVIWDNASPAIKKQIARDRFVRDIKARRAVYRKIGQRQFVNMAVIDMNKSSGAPSGRYLSVVLASRDSAGTAIEELVSYRLEPDGAWKVTGYVIHGAPAAARH
ncbi:uncharacterized protein DUF4019 [Pseudacidovorax intermedius]|uniref:Uncharacterized protein DUF4019 n=2 Tax=Pseudacidovorax intermedius TaxID=433924 RepID=A0A370FB23_9BURK|nr:uncharacterized protein DUF4019 [Pseudacidovorax intermedius]